MCQLRLRPYGVGSAAPGTTYLDDETIKLQETHRALSDFAKIGQLLEIRRRGRSVEQVKTRRTEMTEGCARCALFSEDALLPTRLTPAQPGKIHGLLLTAQVPNKATTKRS
jgi:hypothetical protein